MGDMDSTMQILDQGTTLVMIGGIPRFVTIPRQTRIATEDNKVILLHRHWLLLEHDYRSQVVVKKVTKSHCLTNGTVQTV